ncbi:MAG: helix-turn-helix domain-containing protein [Saprospiraceae bacterium]
MSLYTTPLQFGYFFGLLFALLLWIRGWQEESLSDKLLGWVLFLLAIDIQDYTFGFAGINFLWEELNGFPRSLNLLFGPAVYFYLKSQVNRQFRFNRTALWHLIPWLVYFLFNLAIFLQGRYFVQAWQTSTVYQIANWIETALFLFSYGFYFKKSLTLYQDYRKWAETQFSDTDTVSLFWYRNFLYLMTFTIVFKWTWFLIDVILNLDFYQDWWWNLTTVGIIVYVAITGYRQRQSAQLNFRSPVESAKRVVPDLDTAIWKQKLLHLMEDEKPYLEPELSLADLARKLKIAPPLLSQVINIAFEKNFNDFINAYRVEAFKNCIGSEDLKHLTLLGVALECGFNSKATFNRAFRKHTGQSPSEYGASANHHE